MKNSGWLLTIWRPVACLTAMAYYMAVSRTGDLHALAVYAVSAAFFLASSAILVNWIPAPRSWRTVVFFIEMLWVTLLALYVGPRSDFGLMQAPYVAVAVMVAWVLERRWWWLAIGALTISHLVAGYPAVLGGPVGSSISGLIYTVSIPASGLVGMLIWSLYEEQARSKELIANLADSRAAFERAHRQLQESATHQQEVAVLQERQRLAREIHDTVAHDLTALVVQIQAARRLLERAPEETATTLLRCESIARDALNETRSAVRALHSAGFSYERDIDALERLGRDFSMATGITVHVNADGQAGGLPPDGVRLEQLYRIFQEALTNAHRHGKARLVEATLGVEGGMLCLRISNDGCPPAHLLPGVGLQSMAERAHSLGGTVQFQPGEAVGMTIIVTVPLKEAHLA